MTELALGINRDAKELDVFVESGVYEEVSSVEFQDIETKMNIYRTRSQGAKHGSILDRLIFAVSFAVKSLVFVLKKRNTYDTIIFPTNPPFLYILLLLFKKRRTKYILILYDIYPEIVFRLGKLKSSSLVGFLWRKVDRMTARRADALVVIGRDMRDLVINKYGTDVAERISFIPNWSMDYSNPSVVPLSQFIGNYVVSDKPLLLYSGTMGTTHNVEEILELAKRLSEYNFLLVGGGAKFESIRAAAVDILNVHVEPFVPYRFVSSLLASCKASFVCLEDSFTGLSVPSKSYGIWSAGKPIIGLLSPSSEIGLKIAQSGSGILLPGNDLNEKARRLKEWLENEDFEEIAIICKKLYAEEFTYEKAMSEYNKII